MNIIMYTKKGCPWSKEVRELFDGKKIQYEERDIRENPAFLAEVIAKSGQSKTPTFDIDGEILPNSDRNEVAAFLHKKGHPAF